MLSKVKNHLFVTKNIQSLNFLVEDLREFGLFMTKH